MSLGEAVERRLSEAFDGFLAPILFPDDAKDPAPVLTLLADPPGSGAGRAARALGAPVSSLVSVEDLAAFASSVTGSGDSSAAASAREAGSQWLRMALAHARERRRSLIVQGGFPSSRAVIGTAQGFARAGFAARLAVVVPNRAESLLSTLSMHLAASRSGENVPAVSVTTFDEAWARTRDLVAQAVEFEFDDVVLLDRDGVRANPAGESDSLAVFDRLRSSRMSTLTAARWLSELNRLVEFVQERRAASGAAIETLLELESLALSKVVPQLDLPPRSRVAAEQERRVAARRIALRELVPAAPQTARPTRAPRPGVPTPSRDGMSR